MSPRSSCCPRTPLFGDQTLRGQPAVRVRAKQTQPAAAEQRPRPRPSLGQGLFWETERSSPLSAPRPQCPVPWTFRSSASNPGVFLKPRAAQWCRWLTGTQGPPNQGAPPPANSPAAPWPGTARSGPERPAVSEAHGEPAAPANPQLQDGHTGTPPLPSRCSEAGFSGRCWFACGGRGRAGKGRESGKGEALGLGQREQDPTNVRMQERGGSPRANGPCSQPGGRPGVGEGGGPARLRPLKFRGKPCRSTGRDGRRAPPRVPRKAARARAQERVHVAWVAFGDIYPPREACKPCSSQK